MDWAAEFDIKNTFVANYYGGYYLTESHLKHVCKYIG